MLQIFFPSWVKKNERSWKKPLIQDVFAIFIN